MAGERRVLVVGGGIAGLAAAIDLVDDPTLSVELWESSAMLGGKIATSPFAGVEHIDEGADAFLTRVPHAVELARRVGLTDLTSPTDAHAAVWHNGLHDIPSGVLLGVPASIRPFVTSDLLSWHGKLRADAEPFLPRTDADDSIGALIRARFGNEVHERLVDALVGSIYATDTDRSSLAAVPQLADLAKRHRSLLLGARSMRLAAKPVGTGSPIFGAPRFGMAVLVDAASRYLVDRGATSITGRPAASIEPNGQGWLVNDEPFDALVLATPSRTTARFLKPIAPAASSALAEFEHADIVMVRLAIPETDWPERLRGRSGYLVPKPAQQHVTAASFGSQKWAHWRPDDGAQIVRISLGRDGSPIMHLGDDEIIEAVLEEVGRHLGIDLQPIQISITRWPDAFPQYRPYHHNRVAAVESALPDRFALAGASYRGIGIPACIADGQRAATTIKQSIAIADGLLP